MERKEVVGSRTLIVRRREVVSRDKIVGRRLLDRGRESLKRGNGLDFENGYI